jgi:hypothetical protein
MAGRPAKYDKKMNDQVTKLCLLGATDEELANFFEVCVATINNWKHEHPEFLESIKAGKEDADSKVAQSLYSTALSGNTTAQIFWLKNRRSKQWRDKQEIDHTTDGDKVTGLSVTFVDPKRDSEC